MATDIVVLYNLALDAIGARNKISLPTEESREAEACNLWFPNIRDQVLSSAPWPEATKMERLALIATQDGLPWVQGMPRPDLRNAYALPADCLRPQFLTDFNLFVIQNQALMTDETSPVLVYTFRQTLVSAWSQSLQMAIMYGLAASICAPLTGKTSRTKLLVEQANEHIMAAREIGANTNDFQLETLPDWISARGFGAGSITSQFIYPLGALLHVH